MLCFGSTAVCIDISMKNNKQSSSACKWYLNVDDAITAEHAYGLMLLIQYLKFPWQC